MQPAPRVEPRHHRCHGFTPYGCRNPLLRSIQPAPRVSLPDNVYLNHADNVYLGSVSLMRSIPSFMAMNQHCTSIDLRASANLCERPLAMIQLFF